MGVTLKDVAAHAGVSVPTVSLIINGKDMPFKDKTRAAVLAAVHALNYRPDSMARRNASGSNRRDAVGLLLRSESQSRQANAPVYEFICGVNDVLIDQDQFLVLVKLRQFGLQSTPDGKLTKGRRGAESWPTAPPPRVIAERFVDGLLIETGLPPEMEATIIRYGIPTIWLNTNHHARTDCVYPDEIYAGRRATEHLIRLGHQNIVFVSPNAGPGGFQHYSLNERALGYEQAMTANGLQTKKIYEVEAGSPLLIAELADLLHPRRGAARTTAVVTYELAHAIKIRGQVQELGLRCPQDISIIAAEDLHQFRRSWPEMSGITCNRYQMGSDAAKMMLAKISEDGRPQPSLVVKGDLIPGQTVAVAPPVQSKSMRPRRSLMAAPTR